MRLQVFEYKLVSWRYQERWDLLAKLDRILAFIGFVRSYYSSSFFCGCLVLLVSDRWRVVDEAA